MFSFCEFSESPPPNTARKITQAPEPPRPAPSKHTHTHLPTTSPNHAIQTPHHARAPFDLSSLTPPQAHRYVRQTSPDS
ncbi:uncharacterized protein BDW47DRAFT_105477 [Aspergillus candidus]|uniref:Uncharacterized protein n=1 Tax=Aspergillus candidus TaxID=41067 RepID=A0A2I2FC53_ASPCN|nr:hypothetical protein BDW47DRAFT_105477 [Aspergillus candidus]PLB38202.1 hypothetical protein BDW47DRAFT_105477 [Aspergillus candidus]